ncbi:Protein TED1 domain protein [Saccharomyces cerevisiae]|nr:Protein TED1 domain protein [Saccharomyces cerevisiae]
MLRCAVKKFAYFATFLTIVANIYIYTYPSFHPEQCSWNCSNKNAPLQKDLTFVDKVKNYFSDVSRAMAW